MSENNPRLVTRSTLAWNGTGPQCVIDEKIRANSTKHCTCGKEATRMLGKGAWCSACYSNSRFGAV